MASGPFLRALAASLLLLLFTPGLSTGEEEPPLPPPSPSSPSLSLESAGQPTAGGMAAARALIDTGRFAEALIILGPLVRAEEIDPNTLFLFGLAAVGASHQPDLEGGGAGRRCWMAPSPPFANC